MDNNMNTGTPLTTLNNYLTIYYEYIDIRLFFLSGALTYQVHPGSNCKFSLTTSRMFLVTPFYPVIEISYFQNYRWRIILSDHQNTFPVTHLNKIDRTISYQAIYEWVPEAHLALFLLSPLLSGRCFRAMPDWWYYTTSRLLYWCLADGFENSLY